MNVTIKCPECGRRDRTPAQDTDPEGTSLIELLCEKCSGGDFAEPTYFNASGKELPPTPECDCD